MEDAQLQTSLVARCLGIALRLRISNRYLRIFLSQTEDAQLQTFPSLYKTFVELRYAVKITDKYGEDIPPDAWYLKLLAPLFIAHKSQWFQEIDQLIVFLESTPDLLTHFSCCSLSLPKRQLCSLSTIQFRTFFTYI